MIGTATPGHLAPCRWDTPRTCRARRLLAPGAAGLLAAIAMVLAAPLAHAAVSSAPMHWSRAAVVKDSDAVEHLTIRARAANGQDSFIRFALANAGFKDGELVVTLRQETPKGTLYARQVFERGDYTILSDRFGLRAGGHAVEVVGGKLQIKLDFGKVRATATMSSSHASLALRDGGSKGYIARTLLVPMGRLRIEATDGKERTVDQTATGFAVHEASTATAHRVYDRAVQVHHLHGSRFLVVDYIVLPSERGRRALGFVVLGGQGPTFVGEVSSEKRAAEKADRANSYRVPYEVTVLAVRGEAKAGLRLIGERQVAREDDLADLNYLARKAVGTLMHPVTYTLAGKAEAELRSPAAPEPVAMTAEVRYKYAQVR